MAERRKPDLALAGQEMDEVEDLLFIIHHVCRADIMPLNGTVRDALATLASVSSAKLSLARTEVEVAGGAHG